MSFQQAPSGKPPPPGARYKLAKENQTCGNLKSRHVLNRESRLQRPGLKPEKKRNNHFSETVGKLRVVPRESGRGGGYVSWSGVTWTEWSQERTSESCSSFFW